MVAMRCLDELESSVWPKIRGGLVEFIVEYDGELNVSALEKALRILSDKYTILRSTVQESNECSDGYRFDVSEGKYPKLAIIDGDWRTMCNYSANKGPSDVNLEKNGLANLVVFKEEKHGYLLLGFNHLIFGAAQLHSYISELLQFYTDIVAGNRIGKVEPETFPMPPSELGAKYSKRFNNSYTGFDRREETSSSVESNSNELKNTCGSEWILRLDSTETSSIVDYSHKISVKVPSLIGSAMALAMRSSENFKGVTSLSFCTRSDLGRILGLKSTETMVAVGTSAFALDVSVDKNIQNVAKNLQVKIANSEVYYPGTFFGVQFDIYLNNQGVFPAFPHTENLRWTDLVMPWIRGVKNYEMWIKGDKNLDVHSTLGGYSGANSMGSPGDSFPKCGLVLVKINGQLRIWCQFREDIEDRDKIMEKFMAYLNIEPFLS